MQSDLRDELKAFERDLAQVIARFLRLYDRVEETVRPERPPAPERPIGPNLAMYQ